MGRMGRFDCKGLKDFQQQLGKLQNPDDFVESCAKELAARLLRMVVNTKQGYSCSIQEVTVGG